MTEDQRDITIDRLRTEIVRQHDRIGELEEERDKLRADRDRLSAELQRVVVDEHLDVPPPDEWFDGNYDLTGESPQGSR